MDIKQKPITSSSSSSSYSSSESPKTLPPPQSSTCSSSLFPPLPSQRFQTEQKNFGGFPFLTNPNGTKADGR
ncbi:unnamed protein product [Meloidogyne enterolobii]|uniref:Uncharacterized protein n=1 Tax=Meloidogyne enterolobii TaxID=390850 RepID=A0ACB0ZGP8_MELEN